MSIEIPKDFKGKVFDKNILSDWKNNAILIYFDMEKHTPKEIYQWGTIISDYLSQRVLFIPNDFSELNTLTKEQLKWLIEQCEIQLDNME